MDAQALARQALAAHQRGDLAAALEAYDQLLARAPNVPDLHFNRGVALAQLQRFSEALAAYNRALKLDGNFVLALHPRGLAQARLGRHSEALDSYDAAIRAEPRNAVAWSDRAVTLWALERQDEAMASCDKALALHPRLVPALLARGGFLREQAHLAQALAVFGQALALDSSNADAWNEQGALLRMLGRSDDALASYNRALALKPDCKQALRDRAVLLSVDKRDPGAAMADFERLLALDPEYPRAEGDLLHMKMKVADWNGHDEAVARLTDGVRAGRLVASPFVFQAMSRDPADLMACARLYAESMHPPRRSKPFAVARRERIRIGYMAGEFREHATALLMAGVFEHHDRAAFEIVAVDNGASDGSAMRARLEAAFDSFLEIGQMSDDDAAAAIRDAGIDILVDLNGYFGAARMEVFARRPAPVTVNYLGFPGTLAIPTMDYIIADAVVLPPEEERFFSEAVVRLPFSYQCNDDRRVIGPATSRAAHGLPDDVFVFCSFNQSYKLTPDWFSLWMRILAAVPGSLLWILEDNAQLPANLRREAERRGVAGERLVFAPRIPAADHLARLALADLSLDCEPYNAHTTASDALWAGVPHLTCPGTAFAGRVAASLLKAADLPELIAPDREAYMRRAVALATERTALAALRGRLAQNRTRCALFDTARFTRHLEAAYRRMWESRLSGEKPRGFDVPA
jgi:predicted O-linked N-acetylglucosamine transferase (SPINDLY family)